MFVKRGKRGISPLIATVLLIAFAVSIGAMIMNWGKDTVMSSGECNNTKIEFQQMSNNPIVCYDTLNNRINTIIKNNGNIQVERLMLRTIDSSLEVSESDVDNSQIKSGGILSKNVPLVKSGKFRAEFIPVITYAGKEKICSEQSIGIDDMPKCS